MAGISWACYSIMQQIAELLTDQALRLLVEALSRIMAGTGYGRVTIVIANRKVFSVEVTTSEKPE